MAVHSQPMARMPAVALQLVVCSLLKKAWEEWRRAVACCWSCWGAAAGSRALHA